MLLLLKLGFSVFDLRFDCVLIWDWLLYGEFVTFGCLYVVFGLRKSAFWEFGVSGLIFVVGWFL